MVTYQTPPARTRSLGLDLSVDGARPENERRNADNRGTVVQYPSGAKAWRATEDQQSELTGRARQTKERNGTSQGSDYAQLGSGGSTRTREGAAGSVSAVP